MERKKDWEKQQGKESQGERKGPGQEEKDQSETRLVSEKNSLAAFFGDPLAPGQKIKIVPQTAAPRNRFARRRRVFEAGIGADGCDRPRQILRRAAEATLSRP